MGGGVAGSPVQPPICHDFGGTSCTLESPATEIDLSDETLKQLPLTMPICEILQPTGLVLNRILTKMITVYETDKLKDPNSIVELEQVIQEQMENL